MQHKSLQQKRLWMGSCELNVSAYRAYLNKYIVNPRIRKYCEQGSTIFFASVDLTKSRTNKTFKTHPSDCWRNLMREDKVIHSCSIRWTNRQTHTIKSSETSARLCLLGLNPFLLNQVCTRTHTHAHYKVIGNLSLDYVYFSLGIKQTNEWLSK